ncbi:MAG: zinc-ribbon domain-containing protein [Deltaproteobacteria bacterium]|jgi:CheY-like chemotaxis protein/DNA-directed RNA polymerase subunit RPC12/RpoP|nr:zinc-ribbon domain-containing protein [Deltaproteobacteria bacterium]
MEVICKQCQSKFKIPNEKIPKGRVFSLTCPKCSNKISIDTRPTASPLPEKTLAVSAEPKPGPKKTIFDEIDSGTYDASEKPFDFVEEGIETALLCEPDPAIRAKIRMALEKMKYNTIEPKSAVEALKQMRFHVFNLVVLNELFDTQNPDKNDVLKYMAQLAMNTRRNIFLALVTNRFRTMDSMMAFNKSVNIIVNVNNIDEMQKILKRSVADNTAFYYVFKESLAKTGNA